MQRQPYPASVGWNDNVKLLEGFHIGRGMIASWHNRLTCFIGFTIGNRIPRGLTGGNGQFLAEKTIRDKKAVTSSVTSADCCSFKVRLTKVEMPAWATSTLSS